MTSQHRTDRFRVAAPTLEPDPVFLAMLADLGASSRTTGSRTARPAGLRMIVATASVAVIAAATWAGGIGMGTPLSPADSPSQQEPSGPPSHGDVATPQRDVSISPGSPVSPGLPGTPTDLPDRFVGGNPDSNPDSNAARNGKTSGKQDVKGKKSKSGSGNGNDKDRSRTDAGAESRTGAKSGSKAESRQAQRQAIASRK